jgi:two-component sensor histidine kinase
MYGAFDAQDRLWIGNSDEGLHVLDGTTGQEISLWDKEKQAALLQKNNLINSMLVDTLNNVWLATMRGVYWLNQDQRDFQKVDSDEALKSLQDVATNSLLLASDGTLWSARWGSLTNTWKGQFRHVLTGKDGFVDRQIDGLVEDNQRNIWAGNYEGLYCFHNATQKLKRFTVNDGLISNNTLGRLFRSRDGKELYVGNQNGFNVINVNKLLQSTQHAVLGVSSFQVHEKEKPVDFSRVITLSPEENAFSVDFIALNYRKLHDNEYAYYLQGFEKDWNYSESHHRAYYTNLSPGTYILHMRVGDVLGNWSPDSIITIQVLPAYYETWWFKLLIGAIICAVLYGLYRYRINQLLRLQHVRNRISADLHDELGASLSGISIIGTLAKKDLPNAHPSRAFMERMMEEIHQISGSLDDIVWNISPRNDELSSLIARMTRHASELFEARQIQYHFSMPQHFDHIRLSMEQRRNFYLIFKETINNLIKYSRCTNASISIHVDKKRIRMLIEDDGIGFDPDQPSDRNGLQNLKDRANHLRGELEIQSNQGVGTRVMLDFPIG